MAERQLRRHAYRADVVLPSGAGGLTSHTLRQVFPITEFDVLTANLAIVLATA
jgi:hypothetical protein